MYNDIVFHFAMEEAIMMRGIKATCLFIFIFTFLFSSIGLAISLDDSKYQLIKPEEDLTATMKKVILISGKAPEGMDVLIDVYGAVDLTGKNYSLSKLPDDDIYTLISSKTVRSGALGFGEEIELILGINKVVIKFNISNIPSIEKIFYRYEASQIVESLSASPVTTTAK